MLSRPLAEGDDDPLAEALSGLEPFLPVEDGIYELVLPSYLFQGIEPSFRVSEPLPAVLGHEVPSLFLGHLLERLREDEGVVCVRVVLQVPLPGEAVLLLIWK